MPRTAGVSAKPPETLAHADSKRRVPSYPGWMDDAAERRTWNLMWRSAIGETWHQVIDLPLVERYFLLRREVMAAPGQAPLHSALTRLESDLGLSPKARTTANVTIVEEAPPSIDDKTKRADARSRLREAV